MKITVNTTSEAIKEYGGGGFINTSDVYDVKINFVQVATSKNGAVQLNFNVNYNGNDITIYGPYLFKTDKTPIESSQKLLNRLSTIAGLSDGHQIVTQKESHKLGKEGKLMEIEVIPDFHGIDVKMHVHMKYSMYNDQIQERRDIRTFFTPQGATAEEMQAGTGAGERLKTILEKYVGEDKFTTENGITPEMVMEFRKDRASNSKKDTPKAKPTADSRDDVFGSID